MFMQLKSITNCHHKLILLELFSQASFGLETQISSTEKHLEFKVTLQPHQYIRTQDNNIASMEARNQVNEGCTTQIQGCF